MFIVLEGGEGAGKTSVLHHLAGVLASGAHDVLTTREPGGTPEGLPLRAMLLARSDTVWDPGAELLLMTAARVQHVKRVIQPALDAGRIVLCDRFLGSTLAYQGAGRGLPQELILDLHARFVGSIRPDLTILLDIAPEIGLRRSAARLNAQGQDEGRFEALDIAFHQRVRQSFLDQADGNTIVVDAAETQEAVLAAVVRALAGRLPVPPASH